MRRSIIGILCAGLLLPLALRAADETPALPVTIQDALTACQKWIGENRMYPANFNITSAILKTSDDGKQWWEVTYTKRRSKTNDGKQGFMVLKVAMNKTVERIQNE